MESKHVVQKTEFHNGKGYRVTKTTTVDADGNRTTDTKREELDQGQPVRRISFAP